VRVPNPSPISAGELGRLALRLRESLSKTLGTSAGGVTVELHSTIDGFRYETGRPWWVSAAVTGATIDLGGKSVGGSEWSCEVKRITDLGPGSVRVDMVLLRE